MSMPLSRPNSVPTLVNERYHEEDELLIVQKSQKAGWIIRTSLVFLIILLVWSYFAEINQVTHVKGEIIEAAHLQQIQSPDGGVITALLVQEGSNVVKGQLLATLQSERAAAAVKDSENKVAALRITLSRLQAEAFNKPLQFPPDLEPYKEFIVNQTQLYINRRRAFVDDVESLKGMLKLAQEELKINLELEKSGDVSKSDVLRLKRSTAELSAQIAARRNKYFQDVQTEITKAQEDLNTQSEQLRDRMQVLENTTIFSPVDGIVNNIKIKTIGGVVKPTETVMEISPSGENLILEVKVPTQEIAYVKVDQPATIKLDAYDSAIYGTLSGRVTYISRDVLTQETREGPMSYYKAKIQIDRGSAYKNAERIVLQPGLTAGVDIKAGQRSVLSYLTKPISKTMSNALGER